MTDRHGNADGRRSRNTDGDKTMDALRSYRRRAVGHRCRGPFARPLALVLLLMLASRWLHAEGMLTKFYDVDPGWLEPFSARMVSGDDDDDDDDDDDGHHDVEHITVYDLQGTFERLDVSFPPGSRIGYDRRRCTLYVTNTIENLLRVESIVREISDMPPEVALEVRVTHVPWGELGRMPAGARVPQAGPESVALLLRGRTVSGNALLIEQTAGADTRYRARLMITPTVSADRVIVDLEVELSLVEQHAGRPPGGHLLQPNEVDSTLLVKDGVPALLLCSGPHAADRGEGQQRYMEYVTVKATLVTESGDSYAERRKAIERFRAAWRPGDAPEQ